MNKGLDNMYYKKTFKGMTLLLKKYTLIQSVSFFIF
jgi:hypothetical protein